MPSLVGEAAAEQQAWKAREIDHTSPISAFHAYLPRICTSIG